MEEFYEKEKESIEAAQAKQKNSGTLAKGPNVKQPSYSTKARK